jgi:hypothetical protein
VRALLRHLHADVLQELNEIVDIENIGHILDAHLIGSEQRWRRSPPEPRSWRPAGDGTLKRVSAFDDE